MSSTVSIRLDETSKQQLELLAKSTQRSKSWLAARAIQAYLLQEAEKIRLIEASLARASSPDAVFHSNESVMEWLKSWGTDNVKPAPCK